MEKPFNLLSAGLLFVLTMGNVIPSLAQEPDLTGAWQYEKSDEKGILLVQDGYFTYTQYSAQEFLMSWGGPYHFEGKQMLITVEFNSQQKEEVGRQLAVDFVLRNDQLQVTLDKEKTTWKRIDNGIAPLAGVWQITDREQGGKLVPIHRTGSRKTLKMLSGTRFQWFAINPETKEFSGTGGGTYTFSNGKYTERIEFFSRDNNRVGAALSFDGKLLKGKWHHSGLSSKGDKIYEVWSRTKK